MTWRAQQCSSSSSTTSTVPNSDASTWPSPSPSSPALSSLHGAVTSTITQVAVTAVTIASTKVDFLWPKLETQPVWAVIQRFRPTLKPLNFPASDFRTFTLHLLPPSQTSLPSLGLYNTKTLRFTNNAPPIALLARTE